MKRRTFLKGMATVTVMVAGGQVWRAFGQEGAEFGDGPAFEPWKDWRKGSHEGSLSLVRAGILSSNAYNSQPWLFEVGASKIDLYADVARNLGAFDPFLREMHFSLGCALENLMLAAAAGGYATSLSYLPKNLTPPPPQPKPERVARVELTSGKRSAGELYDAISHRHTNRGAFDPKKPLPATFVHELAASGKDEKDVKTFLFTDEDQRVRIVDIIADASQRLFADPQVGQGVRPWIRTSAEQVQKLRDGAFLDPRESKSGTLAAYKNLMSSARLFGLIAVRDRYDREQTLRAGRVWQRSHLLATVRGLGARPANGAVELIDRERLENRDRSVRELAELTGAPDWQPTFMFYMGYPMAPAAASARRPVVDVVLGSGVSKVS